MKANKIILNGIRIGIILFLFNLTIKYAHSAYLGEGFPSDINYFYLGLRTLITGILYAWLRTFIGKNKKVKSVY